VQGIVSLLDGADRERVEQIWDELRRDFGVSGIYAKRFPHFSYHIAEQYDLARAEAALRALAAKTRPFAAQTSGIGIFTRKDPVIYVPVVRSAKLADLREKIAEFASPLATGVNEFYGEEIWMPHITIAEGDVDLLVLPEIMRRFGERNFRWELRVTNIAIIRAAEDVQEVSCRCEFGG
jgi:2'-5' RNA ligase